MNNQHRFEHMDRLTEQTPETPVRGFTVTGLLPTGDAPKASSWAVANVKNVIKNWPVNSLLVVALQARGTTVSMSGWVNEAAPDDWYEDLSYVLNPIAKIKASNRTPKLAVPLAEISPVHVEHDLLSDFEDVVPGDKEKSFGRDAVPLQVHDAMWDFLPLMKTWAQAGMTMWFSPASELEQQMVASQWKESFEGGPKVERQMYLGTPIRVRTFIHGQGSIPARALAELMIMSQRIGVRPLSASESHELRIPTTDSLIGCAIPEGAVGAIVHFPAASAGRPVPGMKLLPPARRKMPYDPPVKPTQAFRIGRCTDSDGKHRSVWVSPADLCRHMRLVGATGSGKSTAVRGLIGQLIDADYGVMVLDPHGSLCQDLMGDIRDPQKVMYVDFSDTDNVVPFNPLHATTDEEFEARLQAFMNIIIDRDSEEYTGPRWRRAFGLVARGCRALFGEHCSLVQIFSVLGSRELCTRLVEALNPVDKPLASQIDRELAGVADDRSSDLWGWLVCKGEEVLGSQALIRILGTGAHAFDLKKTIDESRAILVNLGLSELGERSAQLVGCALVAEFRQAMLSRKDRTKPYMLVIDEAHMFQYGALPSLLDEARKFGVGVVVCHQRPDQLRFQVKDALSANAGSYIQLRTGNPADAAQASVMLGGWPVNDLVRMKDLTGAAVISRDGVPSEPFSISFDFFKRYAEQLADTTMREWRADQVRALSYEKLVKPYEGLEVVTRDTIGAAIKAFKTQDRDERLDKMSRVPYPTWA